MKTIIITISLLVLFTLASCTTQIRTPPLSEKVPDTLTKPTKSVVVEDVIAEIPVDTNPEILFGLIPQTTNVIFTEVHGFLFTQENRQILLAIVGFYFGTAAAGNKS